MTDSSAPTSDDGELRGRLSTKNFLSHLHVQHGAAAVGGHAHQLGIINANSGDVVSAGEDHPVVALDNGALQSRSLRHPPVSFANVQVKGNDDANGRRTTGQQQAGDDDRSSFLSSCGASNDAVAHLSPRGDVQKKRTPSCTPPNEAAPGGEFTFRCSSTMAQSPNSRSSLPGVDLVGAIICAQHDESPASSVSSPRISGKSTAGEQMFDSWLRETFKLRASTVLAKGGKEGSPIVPKSFIELAKIRREREAIEESDSDSDSSLSTLENDSDGDNSGDKLDKGLARRPPSSSSRPALEVNPRISFKSAAATKETLFAQSRLMSAKAPEAPEELGSGLTSLHRIPRISENRNDGHGGRSKAAMALPRAPMLSPSRPAIEVNPRVSFKTLIPQSPRRDAGRKRPPARIVRDDYEGQTAKTKSGATRGHYFGDDSLELVRVVRKVSPATVEQKATVPAGAAPETIAPAKEAPSETGSETSRGSLVLSSRPVAGTGTRPGTAASIGKTAELDRSSAARPASRGGHGAAEDRAGSLACRDSPTNPTTSSSHGSSASETSNMASPRGKHASTIEVEQVAEMNRSKTTVPPREVAVPKSPGEDTSSAGLHLGTTRFPESVDAPQSMDLPREGNRDQDAIESQPEPTGGKAGALGGIAGGAPSTRTQRRMGIGKIDDSVVERLVPFYVQLKASGGAVKPSKKVASTASESPSDGRDSDSDSSGTGSGDDADRQPEAVLSRSDGQLRPGEEVQQLSGMRERQYPPQQEIVQKTENAENGQDEETRSDRQASAVPPPPSDDERSLEEASEVIDDGDHSEARRRISCSSKEKTAMLSASSSQAGPPAHPVADFRETDPVTTNYQDSSQPALVAANAVSAANSDPRLALSPPTSLISPPLSAEDGNGSDRDGNEKAVSGITREDTRTCVRSREDPQKQGSGRPKREPALTAGVHVVGDPCCASVLADVTATLANRGAVPKSVAFSTAELGGGGSDCGDETLKQDKSDSASSDRGHAAPMEQPRSPTVRGPLLVGTLAEAVASTPHGHFGKNLTAIGPAERSSIDDGGGSMTSDLPPKQAETETDVVGDAVSVSQATRSLMIANTSSVENLAAMSPVASTGDTRREGAWDDGRRGKVGAERVASASRQMLSRRESTAFPDRWSIRILAEAASTLARCGVVGRSADVSLGNNSIVGHVFRGHDRRRHTDKARTRPSGGAGDHRRRPFLPVAPKRSKSDIAATVQGLIFCGSGPSSELPIIVDFGSSLVGVSPACRTDGGDVDSGGGGCVSKGRRRREQRRSRIDIAENVHRWAICGSGSTSELPMIVDSGSIRL